MKTLKEITETYKKTFYTNDDASIALIAAILVGSKLKVPPTWVHIIGPTSGGKSTLLEAFSRVPFVTQLSDITTNTFLSGMSSNTHETSLLLRLGPDFTIFMKDFTTILSKGDDIQEAIIAQMREIYDGSIVKETGNGKSLRWPSDGSKGHATFIMAVTEAIFSMQDKFSDMGTRAINYVLLPQDRKATTKRALRNNQGLEADMLNIQIEFGEFVMDRIRSLPESLPYVDDELEDDIIEVGDFAAICRSIVKRDYKGVKNLALSAEMPMRMSKQLLIIAQLFAFINGGVLEDHLKKAVFKTALDSIPKQRRLILETLARYNRVSIGGLSDAINYPPDRCKEWMEDLQMFDVVRRIKANQRQYWAIKEEYRSILVKHIGIVVEERILESDDDEFSEQYNAPLPGNYVDDLSFETIESKQYVEQQQTREMNLLESQLNSVK